MLIYFINVFLRDRNKNEVLALASGQKNIFDIIFYQT